MLKIPLKLAEIKIREIRLVTKGDKEIPYESKSYLLKRVDVFPPDTVFHFLKCHPIYVVKTKRNYEVVTGGRTFCLAAHCLPPDQTIEVAVIKGTVRKEFIRALRYIDMALTPLVFSYDVSATDFYNYLKLSDPGQEILPSCFPTQSSFARALNIARSALSKNKIKSGSHSEDTCQESDNAESVS